MGRATWLLAGTTVIGFVMTAYLSLDRDRTCPAPNECAELPPRSGSVPALATARRPCIDLDDELARARARPGSSSRDKSPLESRARMTEQIAALLGRQAGESDNEYRARLAEMMQLVLAGPRARAIEMRRVAEGKAHVTAEQSAKLDEAFTKVYADMLASTNTAIAEGRLSPYERNVPGWLQFAGEIGGALEHANHTIALILAPEQLRAMYDTGFDWSEYIGLHAPWENFAVLPKPRDP